MHTRRGVLRFASAASALMVSAVFIDNAAHAQGATTFVAPTGQAGAAEEYWTPELK